MSHPNLSSRTEAEGVQAAGQISSRLIVGMRSYISRRGDLRSRDIIIMVCINGRREVIVFRDGAGL